jgi:hypothetical protein
MQVIVEARESAAFADQGLGSSVAVSDAHKLDSKNLKKLAFGPIDEDPWMTPAHNGDSSARR